MATFAFLACHSSAFATPPGTTIPNEARLDYLNSAGVPSTAYSNVVEVVTTVTRSPAGIEFTRALASGTGDYQEIVGPAACRQAGAFVNLADPVVLGGVQVDPSQVQGISATGTYNLGEPVFIRLTDTDQNLDAAVVDYATVDVSNDVSGDAETIRLVETGVDTGVFAGYVPTAGGAAAAGDCVLQGGSDSLLRLAYTDPADATDSASATAVVSPMSIVFESAAGTPVDGVSVAIVDATSGLPATVYGNDGVSQFPSTIVSGSTVVDSGGTVYAFGAGEYRFPVVADGSYRLLVSPPPAYRAPSTAAVQDLQQLPGAPFVLGPESFGSPFNQSGPVAGSIDIPVDPVEGALYMQKSTQTSVASPGDFVRYELIVENSAESGDAAAVVIADQLPSGVRYVQGSTTRDGTDYADPSVSSDASRLEWPIGNLAPGQQASIAYVVEIVAGRYGQELSNTATATADGGLVSNVAQAKVLMQEDLFRSTSTIVGRVVDGHCSNLTFAEDQGVGGIRVYLEDGRFAVTDEGGRFHFEGLAPGTHVAQMDPDTIPGWYDAAGCETLPQFAGRVDSQFVRTHRGSMTRADFYLRRKPAPESEVDIRLQLQETEDPERVAYVVNVSGGGDVPVRNLNVMLLLPDGVEYAPGTLTIDGVPAGEPRIEGPSVTIAVDDRPGAWQDEIRFEADIRSDADEALATKALGRFDTPADSGRQTPIAETKMVRRFAVIEQASYALNLNFRTLSAELSGGDERYLADLARQWRDVNEISIDAVGHSDSRRISASGRRLFADNYVLSRARASVAANYLAEALGVDAAAISVAGRGPDEPVASNATEYGRWANRRVEITLTGKRPVMPPILELTAPDSGIRSVAIQAPVEKPEAAPAMSKLEEAFFDDTGLPTAQVEPPIAELDPGTALLLPAEDFAPAIPTTKISVKHAPGQAVHVRLNGEPVNALNYDGTDVAADRRVAVSRWRGVDLRDGENAIRVEIRDPGGAVADVIERRIHYSGTAVRGEIVPEMSVLVADGKTRPVIAIRLYDKFGERSRQGAVGSFAVDAPYRSWWEVEFERKNEIVAVGGREPIYRVGPDGVALLELEPTTQAGEARLTLNFDNRRQQDLRVWLSAQPRDWILVGFAEGTVGYNTLSDNMTSAVQAGHEDGYYDEGRVAFFAKGQVKGEYLLTMAYDSDRSRGDNLSRFETAIDPNAYYGLYADRSEQRFDAPSQRKLYLKLERRQFFALFGDYDTGLNVTELARYERRFNGLKSGYQGRNFGYQAFATETRQSFLRDEIRGDGTSGLYRLGSAPIVINSEQVRIEVRDRFDTGEILESRTLARYLDYTLDPLDGTLYFKQPVPSRDASFNPVFIVVEYESESEANEAMIAGGRAALRSADDRVELGVSVVDENRQGAESDLAGVDLRWQIDPETLLKAEVATSSRILNGNDARGNGGQVTLEKRGEILDLRAYLKDIDEDFGLGQQNTAETGILKLGMDGRAQIGRRWFVDGEASWQENHENRASRTLARAQLRYEQDGFTAISGIVHAADEFEDGEVRESNVAELGVSNRFGDVLLRANGSFELGDAGSNADYPATVVLGADYRIAEGVDLFAEFEDASSEVLDAQMTRIGVRATPWARSQVNSSVTSQESEFGPRLFSNVGLVQGFQLRENWVLDVGLDRTETIRSPDLRQFDEERELASGSTSEDFTSWFIGGAYTGELWTANSRIEFRDSDSETRRSLLSGWYREPAMGHGMSAGLNVFTAENGDGTKSVSADFKFGWAWRKAGSRWSFLNRTDFIVDDRERDGQTENGRRIVNNFNANLKVSVQTQLSLQYAFKFVEATFDDDRFTGYTDLIGADIRRAFRPKWDWGAHASIYHSYSSSVIDYGLGLDVGYNVLDNLWLSLGYNIAGFHDGDFSAARYTAAGPYLQLSFKADQHALKAIANRR